MSFTDLERGLWTPPISPTGRNELETGKQPRHALSSITTTTSSSSNRRQQQHTTRSPVSPPAKLPRGMQITRGNSRDSIGLNLSSPSLSSTSSKKSPLTKLTNSPTTPRRQQHPPHPPPVSPKRKSTSHNPMAQHSRFLEDNTRFDTPRPTLTSSAVATATVSGDITKSGSTAESPSVAVAATPRSPHTVPTTLDQHQNSSGNDRILGNTRPGDLDRRQVLSAPLNQLHPSSPASSFGNDDSNHTQLRESARAESSLSHRGVQSAFPASNHETAINIGTDGARESSAHAIAPTETPVTVAAVAATTVVSPSTSLFPSNESSLQNQDHDYDMLVRHVSQQIFNISSNIAVLERLVPCLGQRHKDTVEMRSSLHAVLDSTQDLIKSAHGQIKILARYHQPPTATPPSSIGLRVQTTLSPSEMSSWQRKVLSSRRQTHQRLTKDLSLASRSFQELQQQAVEAERRQVATLRRLSGSASYRRLSQHRSDLMDLSKEDIEAGALQSSDVSTYSYYGKGVGGNGNGNGNTNGYGSAYGYGGAVTGYGSIGVAPFAIHDRELSVQEENLREIMAVDGEMAFQESILQERESEIRKMEEGMGEVLDVMRELGTLVHEQRSGVDFLHDNILQTRGRIQLAQQEVLKASEYQRQSREKLCYLILITSIVGALVMLAFVST